MVKDTERKIEELFDSLERQQKKEKRDTGLKKIITLGKYILISASVITLGAAAFFGGREILKVRHDNDLRKKTAEYHHQYAEVIQELDNVDLTSAATGLSELEQGLAGENDEISSRFNMTEVRGRLQRTSYFINSFDAIETTLSQSACHNLGEITSTYGGWREEVKADSTVSWESILASTRVTSFDQRLKAEPQRCVEEINKRVKEYEDLYSSIINELNQLRPEEAEVIFQELEKSLEKEDKELITMFNLTDTRKAISRVYDLKNDFDILEMRLKCDNIDSVWSEFKKWRASAKEHGTITVSVPFYSEGMEYTVTSHTHDYIQNSFITSMGDGFEETLKAQPQHCIELEEHIMQQRINNKLEGYDSSYNEIIRLVGVPNQAEAQSKLDDFKKAISAESKEIRSKYDLLALGLMIKEDGKYIQQVKSIASKADSAGCDTITPLQNQFNDLTNDIYTYPGFPADEFFNWKVYKQSDEKIKKKANECNFKPRIILEEGRLYATQYKGKRRLIAETNFTCGGMFTKKNCSTVFEAKASPDGRHAVFMTVTPHWLSKDFYIIDTDGTNKVDIKEYLDIHDNDQFCDYSIKQPFWVSNNSFGFNMTSSFDCGFGGGIYQITFDKFNQPIEFEHYKKE